jgi:RNA polymerase sigma-70 factor (ECF subfamily)
MANADQSQAWLEKARQGDLPAMSALLAMYYPTLRARLEARIDQKLKADLDAEDILQQAYLAAFRNIGRFEDRGPNSFLNWMLTIVDSKLADARRVVHRRRREGAWGRPPRGSSTSESCINLLEQLYAHSTTPSRVVRREEAVGALLACISRLSDTHRQVIELRFLKGRSVREAAEELGKSETAVKKLTGRALEELRRLMDGLGEFTRVC